MEDNKKNYFIINRTLLNSDRWLSEKFTKGQAWIDLIGLAQHTKGFFWVRGIQVKLNRSQLGYSQLTLSERWKWSRDKVRRYLSHLESDGDIRQQNNEVTTIITIVNYDRWQITRQQTRQQTIQQKNIKQDTYNKDNTDKNEKNTNKGFNSFSSNSKFKFIPVDFKDPRNIVPTYRKINGVRYRIAWDTSDKRVGIPPERGKEYIPYEELIKLNKK